VDNNGFEHVELSKEETDAGAELDMAARIAGTFGLGKPDVRTVPALALAYLGDCIYELTVRTMLVEQGMSHVDGLNKKASEYAKAPTQSRLLRLIEDELSDDEMAAFKRGRNAKSGSVAKSGTVAEYRVATGFEALMGFLYLQGKNDRVLELIRLAFERDREK